MDDPLQLRARRRYRTLLRQAQSLEKLGQTDETLTTELQRLEQDYPSLKERAGCVEGGTGLSVDPVKSQETSEPKLTSRTPFTFSAASPSAKEKHHNYASSSASPEASVIGKPKHADCVGEERSGAASSITGGASFLFCAATIWSEAYLPTSFSVFSYYLITLLTIIILLLHRYVVDPSSMLGQFISPVLFSCLVHLRGLFLIHLKTPGRISRAMLLVYLFFDLLPSMVFVFLVYTLTSIVLELVEHCFLW
ncbi:uncharacterized protein Tco025E_02894 [Trypanosoma conorhini]|uniref:Transmembrane protein n=1 Tax=Trypanosoma conorhini TaxID=83891 RepID=A0A3R7S7I8_9TRYP|nr:uncharacterized protein Tco025E_02894 [Trypanosoma conorhini]RNF23146.1 hypothetical protein Tco025E_02894 [Trypanosoma conorhini]